MSTYRHYQRRVITGRDDENEHNEELLNEEEPVAPVRLSTLLTRVVYAVSGIVITLLAVRFVLSLFSANRLNVFAEFIYRSSQPFVQPFLGLFGYRTEYGGARFEVETLIAAAVYAILAALIATILTIPSARDDL